LERTVKEEEDGGIKSSENITLLRSINQKIEWLKGNPLIGEPVKKKDIPKELEVDNLFKIRLAQFWRMLYTLVREEIIIHCFVLVIESYPDYNGRFKRKKR